MANKRGPGICPPSCSILFMFLQLLSCSIPGNGKADFSVFAPDKPLLAVVGEEVDLPCHLSLNISAEDMELRWYRDQPSPAMHLHKNGIDVQDEQMAEYQGRTTFLSTRLAQGQAAVRIHNVTALDNGTFHCNFKDGIMSAETTLWLRVAGLGSEPKIQVGPGQSEGVWAQCTSEGWYPEPQVEWRDLGGQSLPSVTNLSASPTTGLFSVVSNVTLLDRDVEGLSCSIISSLLQRRKVAKSYLPAQLSRSLPSMTWRTVLPLILTVAGLAIAGATCLFQKCWTEDVIIYVSPSLDPDTASPKLALSEDGKSVRRLFFDQELPDIPSRFDQDPCVLAREQFSAGKYYWVVQVGHRKAWNLGVCLDSLDPKGRIPKAPTNGLWALELYKETFWALTFPRVRLYPSEPLHQVGILLDCEAGRVSFYNVGSGSLIYTFSGLSFSVPLRPFFCLWTHDPNPLTICTECQDLEALGSPQSQGQKVGSLLHQDP
ncbi:putative butyrophilin-like protein 10 isoform X1 [Canis lupus baileyi]|uniref:Butyrophilin-like protein 10 n=2 Tax=Canis lupus TaxID=9612 RepID=A0A8I3RV47_CANLF|nr:butyrophilin-like protein 10 isoform X1 [Canis lupus familiaris]XP_038541962.1 butyrophilin-like protein 10 isoform X1 [Canis lupus familiaris]